MGTGALSRLALQLQCHVGRRLVFASPWGAAGCLIAAALVIAAVGCARVRMLPASLDWVPRPSGAELVIDTRGQEGGKAALFGHFVTADPARTVLDYYEGAFRGLGLVVERSEDALAARTAKAERTVVIQASKGFSGETFIGIIAMMQPAPPSAIVARPVALPDWVPRFPGSSPKANPGERLAPGLEEAWFETDVAPAEVVAFYRKALGGAGFWLKDGGAGSEESTLNATSDDYLRFVSVVADRKSSGHTNVHLTHRESADPRGPKQAARLPAWVPVYPGVEIFEVQGYRSENSDRGYFVTLANGPTVVAPFGKILRVRGFQVGVELSRKDDPAWGGRIHATAQGGRHEIIADVRPDSARDWRSTVELAWVERAMVPPTPARRRAPTQWVGQPSPGALATWVPTYPEERTVNGGSRWTVYPESGSVNFFTLDDLGKVMRHYKAALAANGFEIRVMPIREEGKLIGFDMMALGRGDKRSVSVNGSFIRRVDTDVSEIQMRFGSNDPPSRRD